jgi:hypothetical protein
MYITIHTICDSHHIAHFSKYNTEKKHPSATLPTTNPTIRDLGSNPSPCGVFGTDSDRKEKY